MINFLEKHKVSAVYIPLILYWVFLLFLTSLPGKDLPNVQVSDKIEHLLAFWGLAVLLKFTLILQKKYIKLNDYSSIYTLLIIGVYAGLDEIHQLFIPGRDCDIRDWLADMSGALLAVLIISYIFRYFKSRSEISGSA